MPIGQSVSISETYVDMKSLLPAIKLVELNFLVCDNLTVTVFLLGLQGRKLNSFLSCVYGAVELPMNTPMKMIDHHINCIFAMGAAL